MTRTSLLSLAAAVLLALAISPVGRTESIGPGSYSGWIVKDRWGGIHLANGPYSLSFEKTVHDTVRPFLGKPATVEVTRLVGTTRFDQSIAEIRGLKAAKSAQGDRLRISMVPGAKRLRAWKLQRLEVVVESVGHDEVVFRLRHLEVLIRRRGPAVAQVALIPRGKDDDGTLWHGRGSFSRMHPHEKLQTSEWTYRAPGGLLRARGPFRYVTSLSVRLPPGEYEACAIYGDANLAKRPDARSASISFDVTD